MRKSRSKRKKPFRLTYYLGSGAYKRCFEVAGNKNLVCLVGSKKDLTSELRGLRRLRKAGFVVPRYLKLQKVEHDGSLVWGLIEEKLNYFYHDGWDSRVPPRKHKNRLMCDAIKYLRTFIRRPNLGIWDMQFAVNSAGRLVIRDVSISPGDNEENRYALGEFISRLSY